MLRLRSEQKQLFGRVIREEAYKEEDFGSGEVNVSPVSSEYVESVSPFDGNTHSAENVPDVKLSFPEQSNEFYWLSQTSHVKVLNLTSKSKSKSKVKDKSLKKPPPGNATAPKKPTPEPQCTNNTEQNDSHTKQMNTAPPVSPASAIITAKNLLQQFLQTKQSNEQPQTIPFDDDALKSIVSYPLMCDKNSPHQVHDVLADTSIRLPSISKVLQATMPESARFALKKWKFAKIAELGLDGFKRYEKETLDRGKNFHAAIEDFLNRGQTPAPDSPIINLWQSIGQSLDELQPKPVLLEQPILHVDLKYKGIIDNVSVVKWVEPYSANRLCLTNTCWFIIYLYSDELCAFEWKTSEKPKPRLAATYDAPVQLCAYLGALNSDPRYDLSVKNGCVVVAYKNGDSANVFNLTESDLRKYWLLWLQRLQEYWIRVRDGTIPDPI